MTPAPRLDVQPDARVVEAAPGETIRTVRLPLKGKGGRHTLYEVVAFKESEPACTAVKREVVALAPR